MMPCFWTTYRRSEPSLAERKSRGWRKPRAKDSSLRANCGCALATDTRKLATNAVDASARSRTARGLLAETGTGCLPGVGGDPAGERLLRRGLARGGCTGRVWLTR